MKKELSAGTKNDSSTNAQDSQVSQPIAKPSVSGSVFKPYWIICVNSYEYDGNEISKGSMHMHYSTRPVMSNNWRRATDDEVNKKKWFKGKWFNLKNV